MQQEQSRKRAAPGAWPTNPPHTLQQGSQRVINTPNTSEMTDAQFIDWTERRGQPSGLPMPDATGNGMLTGGDRQQISQALVQRLHNAQGEQQDLYASQIQRLDNTRGAPAVVEDSDDDGVDLEGRAQQARREAASRRPPRLIPPFIQKLSSFLDDPRNGELIRWADDGRSFIVHDEDRFANELIPEMFKHNNYASFVRQLNMYGFHKQVGLSDNSMRASEKKAKLPSGYRHKYFRRGRPELLWLIEKPKPGNIPSKKKPAKRENKDDQGASYDDDEDTRMLQNLTHNTDMVTVPASDLGQYRNMQREVQDLQKSQQHIYSILKTMRDENKQYIKQAGAMLANHERHESSINAILQFLATFYNQSLQGGNTGNMFPSSMPHQHSSVVEEMGDYNESPTDAPTPPQPVVQRRPLLLTAPPANTQRDRSQARSPVVKKEGSPNLQVPPDVSRRSSAQSTKNASPEPSRAQGLEDADHRNNDILNVINQSNAQQNAQPRYDLSALQQYSQNANGSQGPLSPEDRDAMLSIMANKSGTATPALLANSLPTSMDPSPSLNYLQQNEEQLDMLHRLQQEQDSRLQDFAGRLQPLSPSGSIPGLDFGSSPLQNDDQSQMYSGQYNPQSDGFDFDNYLNDDPLGGTGGYEANPDFDIDWNNLRGDFEDTTGDGIFGDFVAEPNQAVEATAQSTAGGRIIGSAGTSSGTPTPRPTSVQEDVDGEQADAAKRRKLNR